MESTPTAVKRAVPPGAAETGEVFFNADVVLDFFLTRYDRTVEGRRYRKEDLRAAFAPQTDLVSFDLDASASASARRGPALEPEPQPLGAWRLSTANALVAVVPTVRSSRPPPAATTCHIPVPRPARYGSDPMATCALSTFVRSVRPGPCTARALEITTSAEGRSEHESASDRTRRSRDGRAGDAHAVSLP